MRHVTSSSGLSVLRKTTITAILFFSVAFLARGQNNLFTDAYYDFIQSRAWAYEEVTVDWKMAPALQPDFNEALNNLLESNYGAAVIGFTDVLKKDSLFWQAYYFRAAASKYQNQLGKAEADIRTALKFHGDFYEGWVELAKILYLRSKLADSEKALNKAIRLDRSKPVAYYLRGDINLNQNQTRVATNSYKECLAADSTFHDARIMLALLDLGIKNDITRALEHLDRVLQYDSLQKTALLFRAILAHEKDKAQCIRDLDKLLLVSPDHLMGHYIRGIYHTELGNFGPAFSDFRKVIRATETSDNNFVGKQTWLDKKIDLQNAGAYTVTRVFGLPENDALNLQQAYCHILTEKFEDAINTIRRINDPEKEPLAMYLMAVAHEHKGKHNDALVFYDKALGLDNDIADAHKKRGIYFQELKEWRYSVGDMNEVLRLSPESYVIYRIRGVSYFYLREFDNAIADYSRYLEYDSTNKEIIQYRGIAYHENKQLLPAYIDLAVSGSLEMINYPHAKTLIDSVFTRGDTVQAKQYLEKLTDALPAFTEGWVQRFQLELRNNQWEAVHDNIHHVLRNVRVDAARSDYSYLLTLAGISYLKNRHADDAAKMFDEAIKADKENGFAYLERGKLLLARGKAGKAETDLRKASVLGMTEADRVLESLIR